jgi:hypothetical protein
MDVREPADLFKPENFNRVFPLLHAMISGGRVPGGNPKPSQEE